MGKKKFGNRMHRAKNWTADVLAKELKAKGKKKATKRNWMEKIWNIPKR